MKDQVLELELGRFCLAAAQQEEMTFVGEETELCILQMCMYSLV